MKDFHLDIIKNIFGIILTSTDSRILRTPLFFSKMDQFLDKMTAKDPDSIIVSSNTLIEKVQS